MKWFIFSILLLLSSFAAAQDNPDFYSTHVQKVEEKWSRLIPKYAKVQYAGSMGLVSAGVGWNYGKNKQWETDFMIGLIPKYTTDAIKLCLTLKQNFTPWYMQLTKSNFYIEPLSAGFYFNSVLHDDFWAKEPKKYPYSYYGFSTKIRMNICIGQRITYEVPVNMRKHLKSISAFYEISTTDFYLSTYTNSYLKPTDYLNLSFGLKFLR
jgi:hypothetical protein